VLQRFVDVVAGQEPDQQLGKPSPSFEAGERGQGNGVRRCSTVATKRGTVGKSAAELVAEAKGRVENLSVDEVAAEMSTGDAVLVDLREPEELTTNGKIPGSVNVPRGMLEFRADPTSPYHQEPFDPSRRVIVHCASGGRSALAAATLQDMGYQRVAHLEGGFTAWKDAGRPTE